MASKKVRALVSILSLSAIVVAGHLIPGLDNSAIQVGVRNALHILVFAIFAAIVFTLIKHLGMPRAIAVTLLVIATVAATSEFFQRSVGNGLDLIDFVRDLAGAVFALCSIVLWRYSNSDSISIAARYLLRISSALFGVVVFASLVYWMTVIVLSRSVNPILLSFDNWWDRHLYLPINSAVQAPASVAGWPDGAGSVAEVHLSRSSRSGIHILPMVSNWTEYEYLTFIAKMSKGPDTVVTVRVNDRERMQHYSDRFIVRIIVTSKADRVRIPLQEFVAEPGLRSMNLSDIREIVIFARDERDGTVLVLDEFRLE